MPLDFLMVEELLELLVKGDGGFGSAGGVVREVDVHVSAWAITCDLTTPTSVGAEFEAQLDRTRRVGGVNARDTQLVAS